ncbi:ABC transporter permease [Oceanibacterium hippocampi]|uniref:Beta-methylgalactoside transporter inner membrane component n=1 Tax=Oceanibacterium hippocampi TaxID=745714 RepID=A0A1Y5R717_9PROT|nr:ABC transporter permease [Oceanibacterium hippocampi]SLN10707.1 beta-methylgalactoside transporter inner membrane component [Oceanibacterium hippocampi]
MRLEPRETTPAWLGVMAPVAAVVVTLFLSSGLIVWAGAPVGAAYASLVRGALGSVFALSETLTRATPLILTGLAVAVAFRAKLWNIGGEGQLYAGAMAVTWLGTGAFTLPPYLMIPTLFVIGAIAGGILLLIPTILKVRLQVDEVVTTLLLNFVVLLFANWLLFGMWKDPLAMGWPQAAPVVDEGTLPLLVAKTRLHAGFVIAVAVAVLVWALMRFTRWGFEIRAVGLNPEASRFAGLPMNRVILRTALISGGLAGLAGVTEVAGLKGYLTLDISPGFGYTGIAVAMLAGLHPLGVIASAIFIAAIYNGADAMSRAMSISNYLADVITATALLCVLASMLFTRYRLRRG